MSKKQLLILLTLCVSAIGYAQTVGDTFIDNFITYEVTSISPNEVEVSDYDHSGSTDVIIPTAVTNSNTTYDVISIGDDAFNYNGPTGKITSVTFTLPSNITSIGTQAFRDQNLTTVTIPSSVISIGQYAFWHNDLTSVILENGLESIDPHAFSTNQLTDIIIPNSVISIGQAAFQSNQLTSATLSNNLTNIEGSVFQINQLQSIIIPNSVTSISGAAFGNNQLTSLTLSNNLTFIGAGAFRNNDLTHVTIPSTVTDIENSAFRDNFNLATVTSQAITPPAIFVPGINDTFYNRAAVDLIIPSGTSAAYAAGGWTGFNSVTEASPLAIGDTFVVGYITYEVTSIAPDTVKAIDYDMAGGTVVNIPATVSHSVSSYDVTSIGNQAFQANGLTAVTIANSVTVIGSYAFLQNSITEVIIPSGISNIELGVFENNALVSVVIPDGVTNIGVGAFKNNSLTSVTIPSSVVNISIQAFRGNPLSNVFSESVTPPNISTGGSNDSFSSNRSNIHLHIPAGTMGAYVTDTGALWTGFNPVTEDALSIDEFELANSIKIVNTENSLKLIINNSTQFDSYNVYSLTGAKISSGNTTEIPTSTLSKGIYILKLDFDRGIVSKKVIIK